MSERGRSNLRPEGSRSGRLMIIWTASLRLALKPYPLKPVHDRVAALKLLSGLLQALGDTVRG